MVQKPSGGEMKFQITCSVAAAAELSEQECAGQIRRAIHEALQRDRNIHEGMAFSFDAHGKTWSIVVDLQERWVKIMTQGEMDQAVRDGTTRN